MSTFVSVLCFFFSCLLLFYCQVGFFSNFIFRIECIDPFWALFPCLIALPSSCPEGAAAVGDTVLTVCIRTRNKKKLVEEVGDIVQKVSWQDFKELRHIIVVGFSVGLGFLSYRKLIDSTALFDTIDCYDECFGLAISLKIAEDIFWLVIGTLIFSLIIYCTVIDNHRLLYAINR